MKKVKESECERLNIKVDFYEFRWRKCSWDYSDFEAIYHISNELYAGFTYGGDTILFKAKVTKRHEWA